MADFEIESDGNEFEASESYSFDAGRRNISRMTSTANYTAASKSNFGAGYSVGLGDEEEDVYDFDFDDGGIPQKMNTTRSSSRNSPEMIMKKSFDNKPSKLLTSSSLTTSSESAMEKAQRLLQSAKTTATTTVTTKSKQPMSKIQNDFDEDDISIDSNDDQLETNHHNDAIFNNVNTNTLKRSPTFKKEG